MANAVLASKKYIVSLEKITKQVEYCWSKLSACGLRPIQTNEPLKLTLCPKQHGYTGVEVAAYLRENGIECEFADPDFVVLMVTPAITERDLKRVVEILTALPRRAAITERPPSLVTPVRALSVREAMLSPAEVLDVKSCVGRVLAAATVGCPPAVPIVVSGEVISEEAIARFDYYGIQTCAVVSED